MRKNVSISDKEIEAITFALDFVDGRIGSVEDEEQARRISSHCENAHKFLKRANNAKYTLSAKQLREVKELAEAIATVAYSKRN